MSGYLWVFALDLLIGVGVGAWSRKGNKPGAGAALGALIGFAWSAAACLVSLLAMFLFPEPSPLMLFAVTAPLVALFSYGRPDGSGAGMLLP